MRPAHRAFARPGEHPKINAGEQIGRKNPAAPEKKNCK
jgi:hypothetical protein